jgi:hypothetical protein
VGLGLGGHVVERIGVERMVAGTTELAAGHGFHWEILLEKKLADPHGRGAWRGLACATVSSIYTIVTAAVVGGRLPGNAWQADQRGWRPALLLFSL